MSKVLKNRFFAVALDVGTTDIKGSLLDIPSGKELAKASVPNEQRAFGGDVITRLHFAIRREEGLKELNKKVIYAVNKLLKKLAKDASISVTDIKRIVAVGNSAMYHLILMVRPDSLARAPFLPAEKMSREKDANKMGIGIGKGATFKFLPNVSGFVGSDILAVILSTGIHRDIKYNLIMDIGTNGEIALGCKERILAASCASGPAFEGRHIRCGMPAGEGAIVGAKMTKGNFSFRTIAAKRPKGISGSGLIDIISILLDKKIIDRTGRMDEKEFVIYERAGKKIYLIQDDIRQVQLAKAAFAAGIEILRKHLRLNLKNLHRFYITGTFGESIDKNNAKKIGLIPKEVPVNKVTFLKEGALSGAKKVLLEPSGENEINNILAKCEHIGLHKDKDFEEIFAGSMHF